MASSIFNNYKNNVGTIDWSDVGLNFRVMLVTSAYTVDIDSHIHKSDIDVLAVEATGVGYVSAGELLINRTVTQDLVNNFSKYDASDVVWGLSTITARGAIVYLDTGVASTSTLLAYFDFASDKISSSADFTLQWNLDGVYKVS